MAAASGNRRSIVSQEPRLRTGKRVWQNAMLGRTGAAAKRDAVSALEEVGFGRVSNPSPRPCPAETRNGSLWLTLFLDNRDCCCSRRALRRAHAPAWLWPDNKPDAFIDPANLIHVARLAEKDTFDAVFLADHPNSLDRPYVRPFNKTVAVLHLGMADEPSFASRPRQLP